MGRVNILPSILLALLYFHGAESAVFTVKNNCGSAITVAAVTGAGAPIPTGFQLAPKGSRTVNVSPPWSGRLSVGTAPPASLAEFTIGGANNKDFYDISLVDGFNLPISVKPDGAGCQTTSCSANVNSGCPNELAVKGPNGAVIACKSGCLAFNKSQYCCTGAFNNPQTCKPTNYSQIFKRQCPQAYSYAYDDKTSTFTCTTGANYLITFCP